MRPLAFLVTATAFTTVFIGIVVASVTLATNSEQPATPLIGILAN